MPVWQSAAKVATLKRSSAWGKSQIKKWAEHDFGALSGALEAQLHWIDLHARLDSVGM